MGTGGKYSFTDLWQTVIGLNLQLYSNQAESLASETVMERCLKHCQLKALGSILCRCSTDKGATMLQLLNLVIGFLAATAEGHLLVDYLPVSSIYPLKICSRSLGGGTETGTFAETSGAMRLNRSYNLISNMMLVNQEVCRSKLSMFVDVVKMKVSWLSGREASVKCNWFVLAAGCHCRRLWET